MKAVLREETSFWWDRFVEQQVVLKLRKIVECDELL